MKNKINKAKKVAYKGAYEFYKFLFICLMLILVSAFVRAASPIDTAKESNSKAFDQLTISTEQIDKAILVLQEAKARADAAKIILSRSNQGLTAPKTVLENIFFTSYNPEVGQTDSTPCVAGGTQANICELSSKIRPIALSQDLVAWTGRGKIKAGTVVTLKSELDDPRCNGDFVVLDSMNVRYNWRGDIFMMERKDNISCHADVTVTDKIINYKSL